MKKQIFILLSLSTAMSISPTMPENQAQCSEFEDQKTVAKTVVMNLRAIDEEGKKGKRESILAAYDFRKSLQDPNYKITHSGSIKVLQSYSLIDDNNEIHGTTRDAFSVLRQKAKNGA